MAPLVAELDELRRRRDDIAALVADGLLEGTNARRRALDLTDQIDTLRERRSALRSRSPLTDAAQLRALPRRWDRVPVLARRRVQIELGQSTSGP